MSLEVVLFIPLPPFLLQTLAQCGVSRFELCAGPYASGGLTPLLADVSNTAAALHVGAQKVGQEVDVHVMLRPRSGDFVYTAQEIERMNSDIRLLARCGVDGIVFGVLQAKSGSEGGGTEYEVDVEACHSLCEQARMWHSKAVFHRAFDELQDWKAALQTLRECGINAVLTAGGKGSVAERVERLREMIPLAEFLGLEVIVGGGVRSGNIKELQETLSVEWWHSAAITDQGEVPSLDEVRRLLGAIV